MTALFWMYIIGLVIIIFLLFLINLEEDSDNMKMNSFIMFLELKELKEEIEANEKEIEIRKIRCKKCIYYRGLYVHPWSEGIPEEMKGFVKGFSCILPTDEDFIKSFNQRVPNQEDLFVDVLIGTDDSIGCENFVERKTDFQVKRKADD